MLDYVKIKLIEIGFLQPAILFPYSPFDFLNPMPVSSFKAFLVIMFLLALCIALGIWTRIAGLLFGIGYFYIIFLEKAYYNNHLYMFAMIGFMFSWVDAEKYFSIKSFFVSKKTEIGDKFIPRWQLFVFQFMVVMVYFYGGIAKLNPDWLLHMEPIKSSRLAIDDNVWFSFIKSDLGLKFFNYGGLVLDLVISLFLFHKTLKWLALPALLFFNFSNANIFNDIGIFPYLMIMCLTLYFNNEDLKYLYNKFSKKPLASTPKANVLSAQNQPKPSIRTNKYLAYFIIGFFIFQLLFPFRGYILPQNMDWTGAWQSFSWRMKAVSREIVEMQFKVIDPSNDQEIPIDHQQILNNMQIDLLAKNAESVIRFAKFLEAEGMKRNIKDPIVKANIKVKFNGRAPQYFINPDVDLTKVDFSPFETADFVMPLQEY